MRSAGAPTAASPTSPASVPLCVCATCGAPQYLPRPDPTQPTFQCQQCRMIGSDVKVLYVKRSMPQEHFTN